MIKLTLSVLMLLSASACFSQELNYLDRLDSQSLNILAPSSRIEGAPGKMKIAKSSCPILKSNNVRRNIVNTAIQEWGYFGFSILQQSQSSAPLSVPRERRNLPRLSPTESARVASSIAGYWSATNEGSWILNEQNTIWNGPSGIASRWRHPWSAAFISWVMCESGLGQTEEFERGIAHHSYIDQAILARSTLESKAAYTAYDLGQEAIIPGDLLCRGSRPAYRSIQQRRNQLGEGARTHCDIVVKVDTENKQIMTIGGNVRASVRLKIFPAIINNVGHLMTTPNSRRPIFAHLKLSTPIIELNALDNSPTMSNVTTDPFLRVN